LLPPAGYAVVGALLRCPLPFGFAAFVACGITVVALPYTRLVCCARPARRKRGLAGRGRAHAELAQCNGEGRPWCLVQLSHPARERKAAPRNKISPGPSIWPAQRGARPTLSLRKLEYGELEREDERGVWSAPQRLLHWCLVYCLLLFVLGVFNSMRMRVLAAVPDSLPATIFAAKKCDFPTN
jgi:hypothetical protein